ncbi:MAG: cupin domain-containing protein [Acidimicrobiales bacterium]
MTATVGYSADIKPTGIEGGADTNALPWLQSPQAPGWRIKPLRASGESGMFSAIIGLDAGVELRSTVHLGATDMFVLAGKMRYTQGPLAATVEMGTWGYIPANARIEGLEVDEDAELLVNFYGPVAFLDADGHNITSILTALDLQATARDAGVALVPNTLAECMVPRPEPTGQEATPLRIAEQASSRTLVAAEGLATNTATHPHFVDTTAFDFFVDPAVPEFGYKILRVSEETGHVSLLFKHNGVAGPHYHLGAADFLVISGRIGYRAGPPEGYGPGMWFYEPAGARHEATQQVGDEDLIYTACVYGPVQFDEGEGTPIAMVLSWMQYKQIAEAAGTPLVANVFEGDTSLLAWAPLGSEAG